MATIPLPPAEYWRLRYLQTESERAALHAEVVALRGARTAQAAATAFTSALAAAAEAHHFDRTAPLAWSDADTALVQTPPAPPATPPQRRGRTRA